AIPGLALAPQRGAGGDPSGDWPVPCRVAGVGDGAAPGRAGGFGLLGGDRQGRGCRKDRDGADGAAGLDAGAGAHPPRQERRGRQPEGLLTPIALTSCGGRALPVSRKYVLNKKGIAPPPAPIRSIDKG